MIIIEYGNGWHGWENDGQRDFRWTRENAELTVANVETPEQTARGTIIVNVGTPHENHLRILSGSTVLLETKLCVGWRALRLDLDLMKSRTVRFEVKRTFREGLRILGLMFGRFSVASTPNTRFYLGRINKKCEIQQPFINKPFISAYYYLWYFTPEGIRSNQRFAGKWSEGYARALLEPSQFPTLGEYVMNDPDVIETHIDWAADHGIDCFICNWEGMVGHRKFLSENLVHILQGCSDDRSLSEGKIQYSQCDSTGNGWDAVSQGWHNNGYAICNLKRMKFSALIESRLIVDTWPPTANSQECLKAFSEALIYMAENFFGSPQWQRINNRPVVYLYEVYSWKGDKTVFSEFRECLDQAVKSIHDPITEQLFEGVYLIADVLYPYPQDMERLEVFDAVTGYQPYPPVNSYVAENGREGWNFRGKELFRCAAFEEYHRKFVDWGRKSGVGVIPTVIPKYNDRGVRGAIDNYAYPPVSTPPYKDVQDALDTKLFKYNIEAQMRWMDSQLNMLNINSWNEWFEDTSIEPVGYFPEMNLPDYFGQGSNIGTSTCKGHDKRVPDKIVIYDHNGHTWIDTPENVKKSGIDITQGYEWPCYGLYYLFTLKNLFGLSYPTNDRKAWNY
ncbi:MAG: glycoside hydrolase family 71/99 protein [Nitrospiria bacterium]